MGVAAHVLADTARAFGSVADSYADSNERNPILREMRSRVMAEVFAHVPAGSSLLDLGCGPGTDDEALARAGYRITALDGSTRMVAAARARVQACRLADRVEVRHLEIAELDALSPRRFDAVLSNFGPLNCVPDLEQVAGLVADRLRPGGLLVASVIGKLCPWEWAVFLSRGDWGRATVRFSRRLVAVPLNGGVVWTRYYAPGDFERLFAAAGFELVALSGLGVFAPPPYLEAFAARHPGLVRWLHRLDDRLAVHRPLNRLGDHFLIVMRRR